MKARSDLPQLLLLLAGASALTALSLSRLPSLADILRPPSTPFDRSLAAAAAADYRLFWEAAAWIPRGVSVAPISGPRDPVRRRRCTGRPSVSCPAERSYPRPSGTSRRTSKD